MTDQILQAQDGVGVRHDLAEVTTVDPTKYGMRAVDLDAIAKLEAIRLLLAAGSASDVTDRSGRVLGHVSVDNLTADQLVHATNLDITLTALANLIKSGKTLADVVTALASVANLDVALSTRLKPNDPVHDTYGQGQVLPDQAGAGGVLTFAFAAAADLIWVEVWSPTGVLTGPVARVDPFGGTPSAAVGIPVFDTIPKPIVVHVAAAGTVKVYAASGVSVSVWAQGY